jgi:hypothetical protein
MSAAAVVFSVRIPRLPFRCQLAAQHEEAWWSEPGL